MQNNGDKKTLSGEELLTNEASVVTVEKKYDKGVREKKLRKIKQLEVGEKEEHRILKIIKQ